ncbi:RNA methyltransferase [Spiroplasma endosymbiont of Othius punctulatus]|uniref:TrmH family RNA methyltransferase n=1 Tax=Spiroplasma endosymbiont of Othius punctulatus TaxID=3066289 RepID=UPI0030D260B9
MDINTITSTKNEYIKEISKLKTDYSEKYILEGVHTIEEALKYGVIESILFTNKNTIKLSEYGDAIKKYLITEEVAQKISAVKTNQGVFAVCKIIEKEIDLSSNVLVLDDVQDPGNMGTLIRSAKAFGFNSIVAGERSVGFFNPKVVRSTQANHFSMSLVKKNLEQMIKFLKANEYLIVGTFLNQDSKKTITSNTKFKDKKIALILGNEGNGIDIEYLESIDVNYVIKMSEEVESLNVAIAGSIIMSSIYKI